MSVSTTHHRSFSVSSAHDVAKLSPARDVQFVALDFPASENVTTATTAQQRQQNEANPFQQAHALRLELEKLVSVSVPRQQNTQTSATTENESAMEDSEVHSAVHYRPPGFPLLPFRKQRSSIASSSLPPSSKFVAIAYLRNKAQADTTKKDGKRRRVPGFYVGKAIEGKWSNGGTWYSGVITAVVSGDSYDIQYDDGDVEYGVPKDCVRDKDYNEDITYSFGQSVEGRYRGRSQWRPATIKSINDDGTYGILYASGVEDDRVRCDNLQEV